MSTRSYTDLNAYARSRGLVQMVKDAQSSALFGAFLRIVTTESAHCDVRNVIIISARAYKSTCSMCKPAVEYM